VPCNRLGRWRAPNPAPGGCPAPVPALSIRILEGKEGGSGGLAGEGGPCRPRGSRRKENRRVRVGVRGVRSEVGAGSRLLFPLPPPRTRVGKQVFAGSVHVHCSFETVILNKGGEWSETSLFRRGGMSERKAAGYVEAVQSNGHSVSLSFGGVSERGRKGRLTPLSLGSPGARRGTVAPRGIGAEERGTAPRSEGLLLRPLSLPRQNNPPPHADAENARLYICSISEKARLGAGSVFTAAVPDGGGRARELSIFAAG